MIIQKSPSFYVNDRISLQFDGNSGYGDSKDLQKGLIMSLHGKLIGGEGVGFGVPAIVYSNQILFSTTADIRISNGKLEKIFLIDAMQSKRWMNRISLNNFIYRLIQKSLADSYRKDKRFRRILTLLMKIQSELGVQLSHQKITSKGQVIVNYRLSGNELAICVDSTKLIDKNYTGILVFNEQSSNFDLYQDDLETLKDNDIGVWDEVISLNATFRNTKAGVAFTAKQKPRTKLYRGREILKPNLDWAGFCYSIPQNIKYFEYSILLD